MVALAAVAAAFAAVGRSTASDTLVYGASADPALLDPSLTSDGESLRDSHQIFDSLVGFKPGHEHRRARASRRAGRSSKNELAWTFKLRKGVKFSDGTPFNAAAVCSNFTRWYHFPAPLQSDALSYYWQTVFGGFAKPAPGNAGPGQEPLQGLQGARQVLRVDPAEPAVVVVPRGDRPAELRHREPDGAEEVPGGCGHGRRDRRLPSDGDVRDAASRSAPGPYMLAVVADRATSSCSSRNPKYWGTKPKLKRDHLPSRSATPAARLQALQIG